jgi:hypothetical protein
MDRTEKIAVGVCADPKGSISSNGFFSRLHWASKVGLRFAPGD